MQTEISASVAASLLGVVVRTVQDRIKDRRLDGRRNRINGRMYTTPAACLAYIRTVAGEDSSEEAEFMARLKKSSLLVEQPA